MVWEEPELNTVSKTALEHRGVMADPDVAQSRDDAEVNQVQMGRLVLSAIMSWETLGRNYLLKSSQLK